MPTVPTNKIIPDTSTRPDDQSLLMAAAIMHDMGKFDEDGPWGPGGMSKAQKEFIERSRDKEDNPDITKYPAENVVPGQRIEDRERGPSTSPRDVRRI